jgi:hypothetical protein
MDAQSFLTAYVDDLNEAVKSRNFVGLVQKWYALPEARLYFAHEEEGIQKAKRIWDHLLPKGLGGDDGPREVEQVAYKVENGRVFSWRALSGGSLPRPIYGMQETQFDDRTLISELVILSAQEKPEVETDEGVPRTRLGRIFNAFSEAFNDFFITGDSDILLEWVSDDIKMVLVNDFVGMGIMQHMMRIQEQVRFELTEWEQKSDDVIHADIAFQNWGGLDALTVCDITVTPDGKIREMRQGLEIDRAPSAQTQA